MVLKCIFPNVLHLSLLSLIVYVNFANLPLSKLYTALHITFQLIEIL